MKSHPVSFDQLPAYVYELNCKVDQLLERLSSQPIISTQEVRVALNVQQASEFLGVVPQTLYQNIKKIPHHKRFGRLYFFDSELLDYLKNGNAV